MKITLPLFNQAVRGTLPGVGIFRHTAAGPVLTGFYIPTDPRTVAQLRARWRFAELLAEYATGLNDPSETRQAFLARRWASRTTTGPAVENAGHALPPPGTVLNFAAFLPARSIIRSYPA